MAKHTAGSIEYRWERKDILHAEAQRENVSRKVAKRMPHAEAQRVVVIRLWFGYTCERG